MSQVPSNLLRQPTTILLLRHGETAEPDVFHGSESDIGLGPNGRKQAEQVAAKLVLRRPDAVYCSGLRRSFETAEPIAAACGRPLQIEPDLRERAMGALSGFSRVEGWPIYEETKARWMAGDLDYTHEGAESFAEIQTRALPALLRIASRHEGGVVVVVGHGVANRVLILSLVEGFSPADFDAITIEFVKVSELTFDGEAWRLVIRQS